MDSYLIGIGLTVVSVWLGTLAGLLEFAHMHFMSAVIGANVAVVAVCAVISLVNLGRSA